MLKGYMAKKDWEPLFYTFLLRPDLYTLLLHHDF